MKPILFNTEMVQAILEGRKTVTRRTIKPQPIVMVDGKIDGRKPQIIYTSWENFINHKTPYQVGEVLYVRETWKECTKRVGKGQSCHMEKFFVYKADENKPDNPSEFYEGNWNPSIHMPKAAARIFLKVIDVRCERLQDITINDIEKEGYPNEIDFSNMPIAMQGLMFEWWTDTWKSTIKKQDLDRSSLEANPWVYVIEFEVMKEGVLDERR